MKEKIKHYTDSIYYDIELTAKVMKFLGIQVFKKLEIELTPEENAALDTICCHPEICQRDLAKLILKDRANTGRIINSLEKKNLIKRIIDVKNNRLIKKVIITEEGNIKLEEINGKFKAFLENVSCKYTDEEENKLQEAIRTFRKNLEEFVNLNI